MKNKIIVIIILMSLMTWVAPGRVIYGNSVVQKGSYPIWPTFHYNNQRTGQCPYDTSNNNGTLKWWKYPTRGWFASSPAIGSDGTIYVGSHDYLYAIGGK